MKFVTITNGYYFKKEISGRFELADKPVDHVNERYREHGKSMKVFVVENGKTKGIWVNEEDFTVSIDSVPTIEAPSIDDMRYEINKRFSIMNKMADGIISGSVRSVAIAGAAGIGKTYTLERKLEAASDAGSITFAQVKGRISAIGLYCLMHENKEKHSVIVLDDCEVFEDLDTLAILKAALDSSDKRIISWSTASPFLDNKGIPKSFEYEGTCVFITNTDLDGIVRKGNKLAPHVSALLSRSIYLDLKVHTNREIMIRVEDVITNTDMLEKRGLSVSQIADVLAYMNDNVEGLRSVSLRTALHISDFINTDPTNWVDIADVCLLK